MKKEELARNPRWRLAIIENYCQAKAHRRPKVRTRMRRELIFNRAAYNAQKQVFTSR